MDPWGTRLWKKCTFSVPSEELCRSSSLKCYLVIYFFCDDKDERLRSGQKVLTNLLAQILKQCTKALIHFSAESEYNIFREKTSWTFGMLWRVFDRIARDDNLRPICVVLDALSIWYVCSSD
jgi:hypothetical protein